MTVGINEIVPYSSSDELIFAFPRSSELQQQGVNIQNQQLQTVAKDYPERLPSAVNAWLKWVSYTSVEHPTLSLIKAIKEHWKS
ncbi:hypothetical protein cce_2144 [Crocosphaera subtropica ATCC 51142]|uniref:Uncharacterized protein n=1 Tax=Crocosphaera subtropica (strain ATCC 51142 / BH68) TaxID=43989 RepID=B1WNR5_CROS5|nr:hypothetical protein [Crocosphaera subtropica]ACB51494.1 hypothetical protein cce_2144 [Crocosphaera subtropica ATCC 51142]